MLPPLRHEVLGPRLHRFVFASESRPGLTHELLLDLEDGAVSCLCDAALRGRACKHQRLVPELRALAEAREPPS
ncbi:MAG TPA: hypothetical protein VM370_08400 [Candidatus Thermoplasmatota archaeon]|nr:hypothetical protein [Candidatus Thermoplasmatota archaeon]